MGPVLHSLAPQLSASDPAWSPDGRQIAFRAPDPADLEAVRLYVAGADGTGLRVLAAAQSAAASRTTIIDRRAARLVARRHADRLCLRKACRTAGGYVIAVADVATGAIHDLTAGDWRQSSALVARRSVDRVQPCSDELHHRLQSLGLVRPDGSDLRILTDTLVAHRRGCRGRRIRAGRGDRLRSATHRRRHRPHHRVRRRSHRAA